MIAHMRAATAALVGALCGAGWFASLEPSGKLLCRDSATLLCGVGLILFVVPALIIVWAVVGWGLLRLARFSPAWPTAGAGTAGAAVLVLVSSFSLRFLQVQLPEDGAIFLVAIAAAGGYALAAEVNARYGGRRDRTEHRGQDG
jgi:hypothetical protein